MMRDIPPLKYVASAAYHPEPVPHQWPSNDLIFRMCIGRNYALILERRASLEQDKCLWEPPRHNPWQWRIVCAKPVEPGSTTLGTLHTDGSHPSHIPKLGERLHGLIDLMENLPHLVIIEAQWFNGADIAWPKELVRMTEPPKDGPFPEEVQDILEQTQLLEDQWHQEDAMNNQSIGQQECVGVAFTPRAERADSYEWKLGRLCSSIEPLCLIYQYH